MRERAPCTYIRNGTPTLGRAIPLMFDLKWYRMNNGIYQMPKTILQLMSDRCVQGTLISPRSHLIDQYIPECEIISLPPKDFGGGTLSFELRSGTIHAPKSRRRFEMLRQFLRNGAPDTTNHILIDLRLRSPENWAHFLTNHLPIVFIICSKANIDWNDIILILPRNTPEYILEVASMFGFSTGLAK